MTTYERMQMWKSLLDTAVEEAERRLLQIERLNTQIANLEHERDELERRLLKVSVSGTECNSGECITEPMAD